MKVKIKVIVEHEAVLNVPNYVRPTAEAVEEFLVEKYYGFDNEDEAENSFDFKNIKIL